MRESCRIMTRHSSDSSAPHSDSKPAKDRLMSSQTKPDFRFESDLLAKGATLVGGVDEVGRGPLAGPVVAAIVCLDPERIPLGLQDSKKLSEKVRERLFDEILTNATVAIGTASCAEIDCLNIRQATFLAMRRAVSGMSVPPDHVLIDGKDVPVGLGCEATALIGGDNRVASIAAASIVAKVMRDRMMVELCREDPRYGFSRHMGYGTPQHLKALSAHGACQHHRRSFSPVRAVVNGADGARE